MVSALGAPIAVTGSLCRLPTRPKQPGAVKRHDNQLHRARVLEVRIQSPPPERVCELLVPLSGGAPAAACPHLLTAESSGATRAALFATRAHRGTGSSNPLPSSGESASRGILPPHGEKPAFRAGVWARQVQRGQQRRVSRGAWRRPAGISLSGQIPVPRRS